MFWIDLLFVVFFALLLSSIMSWGFRWRHPARRDTVGASFVFLFFILLVVMWASVAWMVPWGPVIYGTHWLGLLLTGVFVSLLILAVAAPVRPIKTRTPAEAEQVRKEVETATAFGVFFWIVVVGLFVAALVSYFL